MYPPDSSSKQDERRFLKYAFKAVREYEPSNQDLAIYSDTKLYAAYSEVKAAYKHYDNFCDKIEKAATEMNVLRRKLKTEKLILLLLIFIRLHI